MRIGLQTKVVIALVVIAVVPLAVAAVLVRDMAAAAQNVAISEADRLAETLQRTRLAYVEAIEARKAAFRDAAVVAAADPRLGAACGGPPAQVAAELDRLVRADRWLGGASLALPGGAQVAVERDLAREGRLGAAEVAPFEHALAQEPGCVLSLVYVSERAAELRSDFEDVGQKLKDHRDLGRISETLPPGYGQAFLALLGGCVAIVTLIGVLVARRTTRRIDRLVAATRRVAEGDLTTHTDDRGRDELGDLGRSFDEMIAELRSSRDEIEYLHKIGAWQEVARRLAHEIKNPLTPIQLAVQQLHTKYPGADDGFRRMLDDAHAIVTEEIAGLRRLVDAFSGFAKLPRVEPRPLDLALVVDDATREVECEIEPPAAPLTVAGDRLLLKRALVNLVENARQAGARRVHVSWRAEEGHALLVVDDDGPGIPAHLRDRVFDPYVTTKPHGTGLGLAIVKKTILEHEGEITVAASSPLGGARFEVILPLATLAPPAMA